MVNTTNPSVISEEDGVYIAFVKVASLKVPVPLEVQVDDNAAPPIFPDNVYESEAQMVALPEAVTVAIGEIEILVFSVTDGHPLEASIVFVMV